MTLKDAVMHARLICPHLGATRVLIWAETVGTLPRLAMHDFMGSESSSPQDLIPGKEGSQTGLR